ncbi:hypothetical protein [Nocardioides panacihumi]|uniref:hypothetical protein n=1 Tax=Nocardioides panacihumi TaxID=400774 RepID=UPI0031D30A62
MTMYSPIAPPPVRPRTLHTWQFVALLAAVAAAFTGVCLYAAWSLNHPHAFTPYSGPTAAGADGIDVGQTLYAGVDFGDSASGTNVTNSVGPVGVTGSARYTVTYLICTLPAHGIGAIGSADSLTGLCSDVTPAAHQTYNTGSERQELVAAVTLLEPGAVTIRGADVDYTAGIQHGHQRVGIDVAVSTASTY